MQNNVDYIHTLIEKINGTSSMSISEISPEEIKSIVETLEKSKSNRNKNNMIILTGYLDNNIPFVVYRMGDKFLLATRNYIINFSDSDDLNIEFYIEQESHKLENSDESFITSSIIGNDLQSEKLGFVSTEHRMGDESDQIVYGLRTSFYAASSDILFSQAEKSILQEDRIKGINNAKKTLNNPQITISSRISTNSQTGNSLSIQYYWDKPSDAVSNGKPRIFMGTYTFTKESHKGKRVFCFVLNDNNEYVPLGIENVDTIQSITEFEQILSECGLNLGHSTGFVSELTNPTDVPNIGIAVMKYLALMKTASEQGIIDTLGPISFKVGDMQISANNMQNTNTYTI